MKLIVGLGNPGEKYENTRHNMGFMVVDRLAKSSWKKGMNGMSKFTWLGSEVEMLKPQTFMNKSGQVVKYAVKKHDIEMQNIIIVHDDLDIKLGEWKIQQGVGPKVHNGVNSITKELGSEDYWRVRIGVDSRKGEMKNIPGEKYVLTQLSNEELSKLERVFDEVVGALKEWCVKG